MQRVGLGDRLRRLGMVLLPSFGLVAVGLSGCGGGDQPAAKQAAQPSESSQTQQAEPVAESQPATDSQSESPAASTAQTDPDGRKWVGDIPYDVFFDDPLAIVSNTQEVAGTTQPPSLPQNTEPAAPEPAPVTESAPSAAGIDWSKVISANVLDNEVKNIRNELTQKLQSVGKYNASTFEIPVHGATLSIMAGIATAHPGDISWKDKAKYVRDLGLTMAEGATGPGRKAYNATLEPFEQIVTLLNGNEPVGLEESDNSVPFADVAERIDAMKRMEQSFQWLRTNTGSEQAMKSEKDKVLHETAVLAAITQAIATEDYYKNDPEVYDEFAKMLVNASVKAGEAANTDNFDQFSQSLDEIQKSCNECHAKERF